jgi:hypothetical protein
MIFVSGPVPASHSQPEQTGMLPGNDQVMKPCVAKNQNPGICHMIKQIFPLAFGNVVSA